MDKPVQTSSILLRTYLLKTLIGDGMKLTPDRFAINQATTRLQWGLAEAIRGYARAGVKGIAIWPDKLAELGIPAAAALMRDFGMTATGYCCGDLFAITDAAALKSSMAHARRRVDEAASLRARCLIAVVGGYLQRSSLADYRERAEEGLAELLPYARAAGVPLAIEPVHPMRAGDICCINTLAQANAICDRLGEGAGVAVDTYHVWWDPGLPAGIEAASGRILAFHLADWLSPTTDLSAGRGMIGDGIIDIAAIASRVEQAGYEGPYEIEVMSQRDWWQRPATDVVAECVTRLNRLAAALDVGSA